MAEFGPRDLKKVRDVLIADGLSRKVINARVNRIRRIFKWGVENELVEPGVLQALQAIAPLKKGRTAARETGGVKPVPREHIDAVLSLVSPQVRTMIQVQELTGMRPGELVIMRPRDIDRSKATWIYRPTFPQNRTPRDRTNDLHWTQGPTAAPAVSVARAGGLPV